MENGKFGYPLKILTALAMLWVNSFTSVAQRRYIKAEGSKAVVPFATIKVAHSNKGEIADSVGAFTLDIEPLDTLIISSAGYQQKVITGNAAGATIYLEQKTTTLQEVVVKEWKLVQSITLGNGATFIDKKLICDFNRPEQDNHCINWGPANLKEEFAEKIILPRSTSTYQIKKILIPIRPSSSIGPLLLRIYLTDTSTGLPGEEIFVQTIPVTRKDLFKDKVVAGLEAERILVHREQAIFISVGWPPGTVWPNGVSSIILKKDNRKNTYSRSLVSKDYRWYPFGIWRTPSGNVEINLSTQYAVVLDELR